MRYGYYISSFFWSTTSKTLSALINFITIPMLLALWGEADYGILTLVSACNGYMYLLDLGMNTGAVKYYSQWEAEGKISIIHRVAHSNTAFYLVISFLNILILSAIACYGESLFNITHDQFRTLQTCLLILILFSVPTWITTSYNQLLVAHKQITYTQKIQCIVSILKLLLVVITLIYRITLPIYYFYFTLITASLLLPYAIKCKKEGLVDNFKIRFYWSDFKIVLQYSLALFALSIFQVTATQSRPIVLGIVADNAAVVATEYRIIEVIPLFIITVGGTLTAIFLPKSAELITNKKQKAIEAFAYQGTTITTILSNILCVPFILGAQDILTAYVGHGYSYLYPWLMLWSVTTLIQIHTTPGNSLILAYGKTKVLVYTSAVACVVSILLNGFLCSYYGVGSAVIGYFIYVLFVIGSYYIVYYKKLLHLSRRKIFMSFIRPTIPAVLSYLICKTFPWDDINWNIESERIFYLVSFSFKAGSWLLLYVCSLFLFKLFRIKNKEIIVS